MKDSNMRTWTSIGTTLLVGFLIGTFPGTAFADCEMPPGPQVNWANCNKASISLTNVDLEGANLQ